MRNTLITVALAAALALAAGAGAQINEVPMKGLGNEWVKQLDLKGRMDWEWIETYPSEVYFATRKDAGRDGDVVTMWTRIEYRDPQGGPVAHRSVASRDAWDCAGKRRSNLSTIYYRWSNLEDGDPQKGTPGLAQWDAVEPGSLGATLLEFACSLEPAAEPSP
jgi:hypothetical protein